MGLQIVKAGMLDTVQDLGRNGYRKYGINPNGAMDRGAVRLLNALLSNTMSEAAIELHFPAAILKFTNDALFAIGGGDFGAKLNDVELDLWTVYRGSKGQKLQFVNRRNGNRCYVSVAGGFSIKEWFSSRSTNLRANRGGFNGRQLMKGDLLAFQTDEPKDIPQLNVGRSMVPSYAKNPEIRIVPGADYERLTAHSEQRLLSQWFRISRNSDRMGYRLKGDSIHLVDDIESISSAVDFGTIQRLPDGQLIVLMADHQTTGGYPKIASVIKKDLPVLAQLGAGDELKFKWVSLAEAEEINFQYEKGFRLMKYAASLK